LYSYIIWITIRHWPSNKLNSCYFRIIQEPELCNFDDKSVRITTLLIHFKINKSINNTLIQFFLQKIAYKKLHRIEKLRRLELRLYFDIWKNQTNFVMTLFKAMQCCDKNKFELSQHIDFSVVVSEILITPNKQFFSVYCIIHCNAVLRLQINRIVQK
jgi:hypothetical protein